MKIKKLISLLAATAMTVTALTGAITVSVVSAADEYATSGTWGSDGKWVLSEDGTLTVTGTGELGHGALTPKFKFVQDVKRLVVGEGITKIDNGFTGSGELQQANVTEMVLPSTLSGDFGFSIRGKAMKDAYIYSKNITIDKNNSTMLPSPGGGIVMHLYKDSETEKCFRSLYDYTDEDIVYIEGDRPEEPEPVPAKVASLTESSGPSGISSKWEWNETSKTLTFSGKSTISIADEYKNYAEETEHIVIESGITTINSNTGIGGVIPSFCGSFTGFTALKDVQLPDTLQAIPICAFRDDANLEEINFPDTLNYIDENAFNGCSKLKSIKLHEGMTICGGAFSSCESLKEVTIHKNVYLVSIYKTGGAGMARDASTFENCTGLEKVVIEDGSRIDNAWFDEIINPNGIPAGFCRGCKSLKTAIIRGGVEYIGLAAFGGCTSLTDMYFYNTGLNTITEKGAGASGNLESITTVNDSLKFHVVQGSTTEQTLKDAGYLTEENTVYIADTTALETAIADAEAIETDKYTEESVAEFTKAIENAKAVLENLDATQDEVDNAVKAIEDAKNALAEKPDEPSTDNSSDSSDPSNSSGNNNQSQSPNTPATPPTAAPTTATPKPTTPPTVTTTAKPAKVKAVKVKAKKKKLNVSWKKVSGATGYEVMSATNNKFTKGKKTVTVKKNKVTLKKLKPKKKYFVKVRAYKLASGRKYFGKWSKVVKKKTK